MLFHDRADHQITGKCHAEVTADHSARERSHQFRERRCRRRGVAPRLGPRRYPRHQHGRRDLRRESQLRQSFRFVPWRERASHAKRSEYTQLDRDGSVLPGLPAVWGRTSGNSGPVVSNAGVTAGAPVAPNPVTEAQTAAYLNAFNHPYSILSLYDTVSTIDTDPLTYTNRDLYHRFYENQMQINGGANNKFAAWADSGGLTMMYIPNNTADHPLWALAQKYVLADNFFQSAFGGSYLNHQYLICSCAPEYPHADTAAAKPSITLLEQDSAGHYLPRLKTAQTPPASALDEPPRFA